MTRPMSRTRTTSRRHDTTDRPSPNQLASSLLLPFYFPQTLLSYPDLVLSIARMHAHPLTPSIRTSVLDEKKRKRHRIVDTRESQEEKIQLEEDREKDGGGQGGQIGLH